MICSHDAAKTGSISENSTGKTKSKQRKDDTAMKRKFRKLLGLLLAVLMAVSLLPAAALAAGGVTINVTNQAELTAALNRTEPVDAIHITQSFTVTEDATIQYGGDKINYYSGTVMTIEEGVTLTIGAGGSIGCFWPSYEGDWETPPLPNASLVNNGTVTVESGGSTAAEFTRNNGDIIVESGGEAVCCADNYGTVTVESGGAYRTSQGADANNHGIITIEKGGEMESRFGSSIINCADGTLTVDGTYYCNCARYDGADHLWFQNSGTVNGSGDVIVRNADPENMQVSSLDAMIEGMMAQLGQTSRFENWEDISIFKQVDVFSYDDLKAAFPGNRTVAGEAVEGDMDVIAVLGADITVTGDDIRTMGKIIVPEGFTLTIADGAALEAGIDNYGTVIVKSGGALSTTMGGDITNYGTLTVEEGATLTSQMGSSVVNNGKLTLDGEFRCGVFHNGEENADVIWFENNGQMAGSGTVTLCQADPENPADLPAAAEALQDALPETITVVADAEAEPAIDSVTVGDETASSNRVPIYGFYTDAYLKAQYVIPASDLEALTGRPITGLTWYLYQPASGGWGMANFEIRLTETEDAALTAFADVSGAAVAYSGPLDGTGPEISVSFTTPYVYQGGNLLISVYNTAKGSYHSAAFNGTTVAGASVQGYSYSSLEDVSPAQQDFLPKTTLFFEAPDAPAPVCTLTGVDITGTGVETQPFSGSFRTNLSGVEHSLTWQDDSASDHVRFSDSPFFTDYDSAHQTTSNFLTTEPETGTPYYVCFTVENTIKDDHSIDFTQLKAADCSLTVAGWDTECVGLYASHTSSADGHNNDNAVLIFKITKRPPAYSISVDPASVTLNAKEGYREGSVSCDINAVSTGTGQVEFIMAGFKDPAMAQQFGLTVGGMSASVYAKAGLAKGTYTAVVVISDLEDRFDPVEVPVTLTVTASGGGGGPVVPTTYEIEVPEAENGTVTVSPLPAEKGAAITVTTIPDEGYETDKVTVTDKNGNEIPVTDNGDGTYGFTMPDSKVTVSAAFKEKESAESGFADVAPDAWYAEAVHYVAENGLMNGIGSNLFDPDGTTTRAMIVTILHRAAGSPQPAGANPFDDVAEGQWYTDAVIWAAENGIVSGYGGGKFGPMDDITREQFAAILYRCAQYKGTAVTPDENILDFGDAADVSGWAVEAVRWAVQLKLMQGDGHGNLLPGAGATRAEAAALIMRFLENVK